MIQQNQQKKLLIKGPNISKNQGHIGFLTKKCLLPPIQSQSKSHEKSKVSPQMFLSIKKRKLPEIYYEERPERQKILTVLPDPIVQNQSAAQNFNSRQEQQTDTVIKIHQKSSKSAQKDKVLCNFHKKRVISLLRQDLQTKQQFQEKLKQKLRKCCETQKSSETSCNQSRMNFLMDPQKYHSMNYLEKKNLKKTPQKLKPLKLNSYQKPEYFDPAPKKYFSAQKSINHRYYLTKQQAQEITSKLSRSKCDLECGKKNCQCNKNRILKQESHLNSRFLNFSSQKQLLKQKLKINLFRLQSIKNNPNPEPHNIDSHSILRKKIKDDKTLRKSKQLKLMRNFKTISIQDHQIQHDSEGHQKSLQAENAGQIGPSRISSEDDSFIKGLVSPSKTTIDNEIRLKRQLQKTVQIQIQTQDILIVRDQDAYINEQNLQKDEVRRQNQNQNQKRIFSQKVNLSKNQPQGSLPQDFENDSLGENSTHKFKTIQTQNIVNESSPISIKGQVIQNKTFAQQKLIFAQQKLTFTQQKLTFAEQKLKQTRKSEFVNVRTISYTFGNASTKFNQKAQNNTMTENFQKIKTQNTNNKRHNLAASTQYWLHFDIIKNVLIDVLSQSYAINPNKPNIVRQVSNQQNKSSRVKIVREVLNQKIQAHAQKQATKIKTPQLSLKPNKHIQQIQSIPISLQTRALKKVQLSPNNTEILAKSRHCVSSNSGKKSINMFNRSPNSIKSSRVKKWFKIPKQSEFVDFIKNYAPLNQQICIQKMILLQNFKVVPESTKFYFGQTIGQSIKNGLGVQITLNQIFQGFYADGTREKGVLKLHDGYYEGTFLNNIRHGHGVYKWDNGQIFQGEWKMGTKNGLGTWKSLGGSIYEGEWLLGMQHGKGKFTHLTSTYEGTFKNFLKQGQGVQTFPNGDKFTGQYLQGKPNGKGKYQWLNGTYYQGDFVNGLRQGYGKWHQNCKTFYEGQFLRDQKHGKGVQYYKNGRYFEGLFANGSLLKGKIFGINKQVIKIIEGG